VQLFGGYLRAIHLRRLLRQLVPFLVTRQVFTGSGSLNFQRGTFELSQRSNLVRSVATPLLFARRKTIVDLKPFLFAPGAVFSPRKRLSLILGDSNLSDTAQWLKVGATALVLDAIECGVDMTDLRVRRPVRSLWDVSLRGPSHEVALRRGGRMTALEIQKEYLRRVSGHILASGPPDPFAQEVLDEWARTLDQIESGSADLPRRLDWSAKKALLDEALPTPESWTELFSWGRVFELAGLEASTRAADLASMIRSAPLLRRWKLRRLLRRQSMDRGLDRGPGPSSGLGLDVDASRFSVMRDVYFQAQKVQFRYHELGGGTGYARTLERAGLLERRTNDEDVLRAIHEPPRDTRARVRSWYVRAQAEKRLALEVGWDSVFIFRPPARVSLSDPFACDLASVGPGDRPGMSDLP
jgi:hypothetical protein